MSSMLFKLSPGKDIIDNKINMKGTTSIKDVHDFIK